MCLMLVLSVVVVIFGFGLVMVGLVGLMCRVNFMFGLMCLY